MATDSAIIKHRVRAETGHAVRVRSLREPISKRLAGYDVIPANPTPEAIAEIASAPTARHYSVVSLRTMVCYMIKD